MPEPRLVRVALPLPLETLFTYGVPERLADKALPGARVEVPFGRRSMQGVIVPGPGPGSAHTDAPDPAALKQIVAVLDDEPALPPELLDLTAWIAEYYACSWGEACKAALPPPAAEALVERYVRIGAEPAAAGPRQQAVLDLLATRPGTWVRAATVVGETGATYATLDALAKRGAIETAEMESSRASAPTDGLTARVTAPELQAHQRAAVESLATALDGGGFASFLLHGVTGSGKTEVYMAALDRATATGRSGIVLVPEIALTPQTVRRFRARFGDQVAVLHSRMASGERFDTWREIRAGRRRVVIGPRSAIFAPVRNLGLVVVDEEHEASYKQFDPAPRYHARDVALVRAARAGAVCVLGSATPSLESWHNAATGKHTLVSMPERVAQPGSAPARLPDVRIVDLVAERKSGRPASAISAALHKAIAKRLADGQQVILLQNRRGYAPVLQCCDCGHSPTCPDCSVTLTVHKAKRQMRCHTCGRAFRLESTCVECGSGALEQLGAGTQRVEEDLAALFPDARLLRMDLDTTGRKDSHDRILARFGAGEADILVGTQMVAKGLDFERVTLVGVIDADAGLLFPDFRSDERIFQLLTQVAGRAGRAELHGEVILQTRHADHPVIRLAKRHDYEGFVNEVLPAREALSWPPFVRLVRIEFRGPEERPVQELAEAWAAAFGESSRGFAGAAPIEAIGPAQAFIARVNRTWRWHVLVRAPRSVPPGALRAAIARTTAGIARLPAGCRITVDVDPMGLI